MAQKNAQELDPFRETIAPAQVDDELEVDEIFTFVYSKVNQIRIWIVQCRRTRQILAFYIGNGSMESCRRLWRKLPYDYQRSVSFSDLWCAYNALSPQTHCMVVKGGGETSHVERLNNTLRQRISRLVRKTLSFSKRAYMLNLHFKLFAYHFNLEHSSTTN